MITKFCTAQEAVKALQKHDKMVESFFEDPMTEAYGAPTGDFLNDFAAKERQILSFIIRNSPEGSEDHKMALGRLEKWMP